MARDPDPRYDSFVLRLWHSVPDNQVLRVEIDHMQTGAVYIGRGVAFEWILETVIGAVATTVPHDEFQDDTTYQAPDCEA